MNFAAPQPISGHSRKLPIRDDVSPWTDADGDTRITIDDRGDIDALGARKLALKAALKAAAIGLIGSSHSVYYDTVEYRVDGNGVRRVDVGPDGQTLGSRYV